MLGMHRYDGPLRSPSGSDASGIPFGHADSCGCDCAVGGGGGGGGAKSGLDGLDEGLADHGRMVCLEIGLGITCGGGRYLIRAWF